MAPPKAPADDYPGATQQVFAIVSVDDNGNFKDYTPLQVDGDCVGISEIAEQLSVSRQRASQLARQPDFPPPVARTKAGSFWLKSDIVQFSVARQARVAKHLGIPRGSRATS